MSLLNAEVEVILTVKVKVGNWQPTATFLDIREDAIKQAKNKACRLLGGECTVVQATAVNVLIKGEAK